MSSAHANLRTLLSNVRMKRLFVLASFPKSTCPAFVSAANYSSMKKPDKLLKTVAKVLPKKEESSTESSEDSPDNTIVDKSARTTTNVDVNNVPKKVTTDNQNNRVIEQEAPKVVDVAGRPVQVAETTIKHESEKPPTAKEVEHHENLVVNGVGLPTKSPSSSSIGPAEPPTPSSSATNGIAVESKVSSSTTVVGPPELNKNSPVSCTTATSRTPTRSDSLIGLPSFEQVSTFIKTTILPTEKSLEEIRHEKMLVRPAICKVPLKEVKEFAISLSGCGFLGTYHFGAVSCFIKHGEPVMSKVIRISGVSAGSLVGSLLLLAPEKMHLGLDILYEMADELNRLKFGALTPGYFLNERLIRIADKVLPQDISPAQDKLYISLTNHVTRKNEMKSKFPSREYLIQCLLASCYIPMYSMGYHANPPLIDNVAYIDGGYTNNLPDFEEVRTITISPFSGSAEISPSDDRNLFDWKMTICNQIMKVNMQNIVRGAQALFPPNRAVLKQYYESGYKDAFKFLLDNELLKRPEGTPV